MKQIIMALAITAFAYCGAEAQVCGTKSLAKHHGVALRSLKQKTVTQSCRLLPYQVCSINADRRSVTCYPTIDPNAIQPLNDETTSYGATGKLPGQVDQPKIETIVLKGERKGDYCIRDAENHETICYHDGGELIRDDDGFYHYR